MKGSSLNIVAPGVDDIIVDMEARSFWIKHFGGKRVVEKGVLVEKLIPEYRQIPAKDIVRAADVMGNDRDLMVTALDFHNFTMDGGLR